MPNGAEPARPLDDVDRAIIGLLRADGRAIGASIGLTETSVTTRVRGLLGRQALAITTVFDWEKVGYRHDLWLKIRSDGDPAVTMVTMVTGRDNLLLVGNYDDHAQMRDSLARLRRLPGVHAIQNSVITEVVALDYHLARFVEDDPT